MPNASNATKTAANRDLPADIKDRLIVALDLDSIAEAQQMVRQLEGIVSFFKVGLGLLYVAGFDSLIASLITSGKQLFLDTKMFDIPQTVARGIASVAQRGVSFVTVHGDEAIMRAAVKAKGTSDLKIFAVTVLTSLDDEAAKAMGYAHSVRDLVTLRARKAVECGCDGIIASAEDDPNRLRSLAQSQSLLITTPGIRMPGGETHDQKRVATPRQAIENGADCLVVGRPIIAAPNPRQAAMRIIEDMRAGAQSG
ncbi:MAG: orotidine-5'-phosphate decarboxylase [Acetobacteraceae bacterium]